MLTFGYGDTHRGMHREQNEDRYHIDDELGLYVVCDGMGGHAAGEVASQITIEAVVGVVEGRRSLLSEVRDGRAGAGSLTMVVDQAVEAASRAVHHKASTEPALAGMGCTLTILLVAGSQAVLGHVGDTRLYLIRGGEAHRLTVDHTVAQELARGGHITEAAARNHPYASVLYRNIGSQEVAQADTLALEVLPGDRYLLCSDGLHRYVPDGSWLAAEASRGMARAVPGQLVAFANQAGGEDNITVVTVRVAAAEGDEEQAEERRVDLEARLGALDKVFLFEYLPLRKQTRVLGAFVDQACSSREILVRRGDEASSLWVVLDGELAVEREGQDPVVLRPGQHIGGSTLLRPRPARATLRATRDSRVLRLDHDRFQALVRARPYLGVTLLQRLGRRLSRDYEGALAAVDHPNDPGQQLPLARRY